MQAAIACLHTGAPRAEATDWKQIAALYDTLTRMVPSAMVALNRAASVGMARGPEAGLAAVAELDGVEELTDHHLLHVTRAELLRRLGRFDEAADAYRRALQVLPDHGSAATDLRLRLAGLPNADAPRP